MKLRLHSLLAIALSGMLIGCTSSIRSDIDNVSEVELHTKAQNELDNGNLKTSISVLEALDKSFPFGPYSQQVQLDLIYAYYKSGDLPLAIASIDRFLKLNPTHPNIDWVIYIRGLSNMAQDDNTIQGWFNVDRSDRDAEFAKAAFKDFSYLVASFPSSYYTADAYKRLVYLKNRISRYQLKVAQFYTERGAYVAVINRVTKMLSMFPDTDSTKQGLLLMHNAYNKLNLSDEAQKVDQLIQANLVNMPKEQQKTFLSKFTSVFNGG
ncbi:membrane biogenesis protein [Gilliamella sp. Choc4-2]|jgi:outer membrane protein assembly factor BamD|uniref:outer membrane protein assembly factor BamD n=1 Tax=unclassified Gilliamella TaxID=2685620 RepID=UPI0004DD316F|nr:outer membrane protein assembly factor BamD [Gilliamella apicola]KFA59318.1 putative component of the lipoprotein assembly complex (forms a complex with YaeT, YfgL, and NlpB) [Gilliamella apicola]OCG32606.1 membrane biogenesis protein [Gilliamella apicola]OCG46374.1 membrane biogenesis protein [Gilliamella apicola]OCG53726.1 membrane biogenesis protein [Gilliamella apicola]OCG64272.1 membrane biogenesis protein [Gilliamella apicola]